MVMMMHTITTDASIVLGCLAARHVVLNTMRTDINYYPVLFALTFAVTFYGSSDYRLSLLLSILVVLGRVVYRYSMPREIVEKSTGPHNTAAFGLAVAAALGASRLMAGHGNSVSVRYATFLGGYYLLGSTAEWVLHKYVMHCHANAPIILKTPLAGTCKTHMSHHTSVKADMKLEDTASSKEHREGELYFSWKLTAEMVVLLVPLTLALNKILHTEVPIKYQIVLVVVSVLGFSHIWNGIHPEMHDYDGGRPSILSKPFGVGKVEKENLLHLNHEKHHLVKGDRKGNYNVVMLGMDEILGTNRIMKMDPPKKESSGQADRVMIDMTAVGPETRWLRGGEDSEFYPLPIKTIEPFVLRHTPINTKGSSSFKFGTTSSFQIPVTGDYLGSLVLEVNLPPLPPGTGGKYKSKVGMMVWQRVRLLYNGTVLQDIERLYVDLKQRLFMPPEYHDGWGKMIGDVDGGLSSETDQVLFFPLPLACGRELHRPKPHDRVWLPLMGLKDGDMQVDIVWSSGLDDLLQDGSSVSESDAISYEAQVNVRLMAVVAEVGREAKMRALNQPSLILIDKVQDVEGVTYDENIRGDDGGMGRIAKKEVRLSLAEVNGPAKSLIWTAYDDSAPPFTYRSRSFFGPPSLSLGGFQYRFQDENVTHFKMDLVSSVENSHPIESLANSSIISYFFGTIGDYYNPTSTLNFATLGTSPELVVKLNESSTNTAVKLFVTSVQILQFTVGKYRLLFQS